MATEPYGFLDPAWGCRYYGPVETDETGIWWWKDENRVRHPLVPLWLYSR